MATGYEIDFTDQNALRSFELREYTTNGPVSPQNGTLDSKATTASTTLLLYGKGSPNYGERIQENMLHLLENFAGEIEPVYPIPGQMWFDRSRTPAQLRVYDALRYGIVADPDNSGDVHWIAINPPNATEESELLARYVGGARVRVVNGTTGQQFEFLVATSAAVRGGGQVAFKISPTPSIALTTGSWYIGGWESVVQNNAPLSENLDAGSFNIVNLANPAANQHAATKYYVDTTIASAISTIDTIGELADVYITAPADDHVLVYDSSLNGGSGGWRNDSGASVFLPVTGGTMTGAVDMTGNFILNVATPLSSDDAANKGYVDALVASLSGSIPASLDDLSDVTLTTPGVGSVLIFQGSQWIDQTAATFITNNNIVTVSGATMTGPLYLHTITPTISNEAAPKGYVDAQIAAAISASGDGVVDSVTFDLLTKDLTLTRTAGLGPLTVSLAGSGGTTVDITHTIADPNNTAVVPEEPVALAWERYEYDNVSYPTVPTEDLFVDLNVALGKLGAPRGKVVFTSNGNSVVNLGPGSVAGQCNPVLPNGGPVYAVGSNRLNVFVNGVKYIGSEHGYREAAAATPPDFGLWHGTETGLNPATTYTFDISVNGQAAVTISVLGSDALRVGNLADAINAITDTNYFSSGSPDSRYAFGVEIHDGSIFFVSALPGAGSSINLTDGSTNPLFANMIGNVSGTGSFTIDLPLSNGETNGYPPADYGYNESGRPGTESQIFTFLGTPPPAGAVVEILIDPDLFVEQS